MKRVIILVLCFSLLLMSFALGESEADKTALYDEKSIELDLSKMSGTIVYAQVYNMMVEPDQYLGKVIRIKGLYDEYHDPETDIIYFACVIPDATACCAQGIEFVWYGEHIYPDDYPEPGSTVTVTGRLESYLENGYLYLHLVDADLVKES